MKQKKLFIDGMHCAACTSRVQKVLTDVPGISAATVSHRQGSATVSFTGVLDEERVAIALSDVGYKLITEQSNHRWLSTDKEIWIHFVFSAFILLVLYLVFRDVGWFGGMIQGTSFGAVVLLGLIAGISTCMAVVGGVLLSVSSYWSQSGSTFWSKWMPQLWFQGGRMLGFFVFGGLLGLLGSVVQLQGWGYVIIFLVVGYIVLMQGIRLTHISPKISSYPLGLPSSVHSFFLSLFGARSKEAEASVLGAATFFLPCGFTLVAQGLAIASGNFWIAGAIMFAFALGTLPGLLGIGSVTLLGRGMLGKLLFRFLGVVLMVFAAYNILRGWNSFVGLRSAMIPQSDIVYPITQEQDIYIIQDARGYHPSTIRVSVGTKINFHIDSQNQYSCASTISIPAAGVQAILLPGDNVFEVIADRVGKIPFGCTMGMMYRGEIIVEE